MTLLSTNHFFPDGLYWDICYIYIYILYTIYTYSPGLVAQLFGASSCPYTKGFGSVPSKGVYSRQLIDVSLSH